MISLDKIPKGITCGANETVSILINECNIFLVKSPTVLDVAKRSRVSQVADDEHLVDFRNVLSNVSCYVAWGYTFFTV